MEGRRGGGRTERERESRIFELEGREVEKKEGCVCVYLLLRNGGQEGGRMNA